MLEPGLIFPFRCETAQVSAVWYTKRDWRPPDVSTIMKVRFWGKELPRVSFEEEARVTGGKTEPPGRSTKDSLMREVTGLSTFKLLYLETFEWDESVLKEDFPVPLSPETVSDISPTLPTCA